MGEERQSRRMSSGSRAAWSASSSCGRGESSVVAHRGGRRLGLQFDRLDRSVFVSSKFALCHIDVVG